MKTRIAIWVGVGLLVAGILLWPSCERARESARRSSAMSLVRQMGLAVMQYSIDHNGEFPASLDEPGLQAHFPFKPRSPGLRYYRPGKDASGDTPLLVDSYPNGCNVFFLGGQAKFLKQAPTPTSLDSTNGVKQP